MYQIIPETIFETVKTREWESYFCKLENYSSIWKYRESHSNLFYWYIQQVN